MNFFDEHHFSLYHSNPEHRGESHHVPIYYGVQYNHAGRFFLAVNHGEKRIYEGSYAFITHPGAFFEYGNLDNEPRHHNFICSHGERVKKYVETGLLPVNTDNQAMAIKDPERFLDIMIRIMSLLRKSAPVTPPYAVLLFEELLLLLHESASTESLIPPFHENYFKHLISEVRHHPEQEWDFSREAARRGLTLTHFRRLFRAIAGVPPLQFQIHCRLELAARMLAETADSIGRIADWVGIDNEFYFSKIFKKKYRISPLKYRREFASLRK